MDVTTKYDEEVIQMIEWIQINHPDCIKFVLDPVTITSIQFYMSLDEVRHYETLLLYYGCMFLVAIIEYCIEVEDYERCAKLVTAIKQTSKLTKSNLPTSINSKWVRDYINLTPLQMLNKIKK